MVLTASAMMPLGTVAPHFVLPNAMITGQPVNLKTLPKAEGTVIIFMCNHCPYVKHILPTLLTVARDYQNKGIRFIAISANDATAYPEDAPGKMAELAKKLDFPFAYLYDESQVVARAYQAACTPDFYVFDANLRCVYRGRFDDSSPGKDVPVTGNDLTQALEALLAGKPIPGPQLPSMGCNIKWKEN